MKVAPHSFGQLFRPDKGSVWAKDNLLYTWEPLPSCLVEAMTLDVHSLTTCIILQVRMFVDGFIKMKELGFLPPAIIGALIVNNNLVSPAIDTVVP